PPGATAAVSAPELPTETETQTATAAGTAFAARLAAAPAGEQAGAVLDAVLAQVGSVLGHASPADVDARLSFRDLGFDSPSILDLRNRVNRLTGLRLPSTALFDNPTPARLAQRVLAELTGAVDPEHAASAAVAVDEPVAIVGMACRYPGGVVSAEGLWGLVASGGDGVGEFPSDRGWDRERLLGGDGPGSSVVGRGGFVYDAAQFDAEHFGISPREALAMDPQQRLLLECAWEALEDAGIDPSSLRESDTGVYVGAMSQEYGPRLHEADAGSAGYALTGTEASVISGRVAYVLGLEGPAVSVDTACSSSLVALHLACGALRGGECSMALAGGATVLVTPQPFVEFSRQGGLSSDGRCRAFGSAADGTGFSDGAGLLVLERLSVARSRGHRVLGLVRGSAVNQDGASNGLTAPSGRSQERVIRAALANAGLEAGDVDVVEGHGTGTVLGDPIEAGALIGVYGRGRVGAPLWLGSLKSNIGHAQAAAGVGGVIKMVSALRHQLLPATLWVDEPSRHVEWEGSGVALLARAVGWPAGERVRRAGVSSFGISGTNAHVVLEEAPPQPPVAVSEIGSRMLPFLVSGSSEAALAAQASRLREFVAERPELDLPRVAGSLALGRAQLSHRAVALAGERGELVECLAAFERGELVDGLLAGVAGRDRRVGFVFSGQGSQWDGMALELWQTSAVFAKGMQECEQALSGHLDWSLSDVLRGVPGAPSLERVDVVQPALFAVMVSLAGLWRCFGVAPAAVVGHSQGEIAAAVVAGVLSLKDGARVVALRSQALREVLSGHGGMVSVGLPADRVQDYLTGFDGRVSLAAVNGPSAVVVSGQPDALDQLIAVCERDGIRAKRLAVDYASHSAQIEILHQQLVDQLGPIQPAASEIALYSTVTGTRIKTTEMGAEHWYRNLRHTVQFQQALTAMAGDQINALIEISPHPVLTAAALETIETTGIDPATIAVIGSLRRDDGGLERFIRSLAEAHTTGIAIDWSALFGNDTPHEQLPTYAFQHHRYWLTPQHTTRDASALGQTPAQHPLLDAVLTLPPGQGTVFTGQLSLERHPWLADHIIAGNTLLPASAFLELALHAGAHTNTPTIQELTLTTPLPLHPEHPIAIQITITDPDPHHHRQLTIHS
ncbi:MAG: type I polyketide synthase, partial [Pseudonocardiaceae bacterium]